MIYNGYYKVMSNIPKMGQLPTTANTYGIHGCLHGAVCGKTNFDNWEFASE